MKDVIVFAITMIITSIIINTICLIRAKKKYTKSIFIKKKVRNKVKSESDIYLDDLWKIIKEKGVLIKVMDIDDNFLLSPFTCYKKNLGAVPVENSWGDICAVYVAYEDFDGSIKYYIYPQRSYKKYNS